MPTIWKCTIGISDDVQLPDGCDYPMRVAIRQAFRRITGVDDEFCFSGWGAELTVAQQLCLSLKPPQPKAE